MYLLMTMCTRNKASAGFYMVGRNPNKQPQQHTTTVQPPPPNYAAPSSAAYGDNSQIRQSPPTTRVDTLSRQFAAPPVKSADGATSVQDNPFDVDVYLLQQSRDHRQQGSGGGTSTFKTSADAPAKPVRSPRIGRR
jgi:hypothetical protein